jgi:hypothetical protein
MRAMAWMQVQLMGAINLAESAFGDEFQYDPFVLDDVSGGKNFALTGAHNQTNSLKHNMYSKNYFLAAQLTI